MLLELHGWNTHFYEHISAIARIFLAVHVRREIRFFVEGVVKRAVALDVAGRQGHHRRSPNDMPQSVVLRGCSFHSSPR